jgi:transglutaminase-like putative cysteine protease
MTAALDQPSPSAARVALPDGWAAAAVQLALAAAAGVVLGRSFARIYESAAALTGPVAVAALAGVALVAVTAGARRWTASSVFLAAAAALPVVVPVAIGRPPAPGNVVEAARALGRGPAAVLSSPLPVAVRPELLALPVAVVFATVVVAAYVSLRTRAPAAPALPFLVATLVPALLGVGGPAPAPAWSALLVGLVGALVLVRAAAPAPGSGGGVAQPGRDRRPAALVTAGALLVAVAVVGSVLATRLPGVGGSPALDPRHVPTGPHSDTLHPLAAVNAELSLPRRMDRVIAELPRGTTLLRTTVLDRYDGVSFQPTVELGPAGSVLPPARTPAPAGSREATLRMEVRDLPDDFLPLAGTPTAVRGLTVRWDPRTTTLRADPAPAAGTRFEIDTLVRDVADDELVGAHRDREGADATEAGRAVDQAAVMAEVAATEVRNRLVAQSGSADVRALRALQAFLADEGRFALSPRPVNGESLKQLTALVSVAPERGARKVGSTTQYAAAFAVLARTLGFATRVAVGYRAPATNGEPVTLTSGDAAAWAEVKLAGLGWVPFAAGPRGTGSAADRPAPTTATTVAARVLPAPPPPAEVPTTLPGDGNGTGGASGGGWGPGLLAGAAAVLVAAPLAAAVVAAAVRRRRRRRRERAADPARRTLGAWEQAVDHLRGAGVPLGAGMTAGDVVAATVTAAGSRPAGTLAMLGDLANRARFAPGVVAPEVADRSWALADEVRSQAPRRDVAGMTRGRRLAWWFDPRRP